MATFNQNEDQIPLGKSIDDSIWYVKRNNNAKYTFTSNSKDLIVKETLKESIAMGEGMYAISQTFDAKKEGTYTVTIKETYNKVTRTVGKVKYTVLKATVMDETELELGDSMWAFYLLRNPRNDVKYLFVTEDSSIIEISEQNDNVSMKALKPGTATVKVYEDTESIDESKLIGTCTFTVNAVELESLDIYFPETATYVGGDDIEFETSKVPYNAPETITITSSDPSVATVSELDEYGKGIVTPVGAGETTITFTCGDYTETKTITVYADEDEYYENY